MRLSKALISLAVIMLLTIFAAVSALPVSASETDVTDIREPAVGSVDENGTEYSADADGDGIADKYQAAVTFRVVNGVFADGGTEIKLTVTLRDESGEPAAAEDGGRAVLGAEDIPAALPDSDCEGGTWSPELSDGTVIAEDTEFVLTFAAVPLRTVTVIFVDENGASVGEAVSVNVSTDGKALADGREYDVSELLAPVINDGAMVLDSVEGDTAGVADGDAIVKAVYAVDANGDSIADKYQVTVTFTAVNGTFNGEDTAFVVLTLRNEAGQLATAEMGGAVVLEAVDIPLAQPDDGYEGGGWTEAESPDGTVISADASFSYKFDAVQSSVSTVPMIGTAAVSYNNDRAAAQSPAISCIYEVVYNTAAAQPETEQAVADADNRADTEEPSKTDMPAAEEPVRIEDNIPPLAPAKDNTKNDNESTKGYMSHIFASTVTVIVLGILFFVIITVRKKKYEEEDKQA